MPALQQPPLSLYIHIPWCVKKCPYCDFNSHHLTQTLPEKAYVQALIQDLEHDLTWISPRPIQSIFIGGGTPSLFSAEAYKELFMQLQQRLEFAPNIEITLEANPGTFEAQKFAAYKELGINRLSIGVQSFNNTQLKKLGRIHTGEQAEKAIIQAQQAGFNRLNLDLMHGLPEQTPTQALDDLQRALAFNPQHVSWYQLTIEPNTAFYNAPPVLPDDEHLWEIQQLGQSLLAKHGLVQYEISAYARAGKQAKHNLNYWQFGDYLGIGAGAHGKLTLVADNRIVRTQKKRMPKSYLSTRQYMAKQSDIAPAQRSLEFMLNALRLKKGVKKELFSQRTGQALNDIAKPIAQAQAQGLLQISTSHIAPSQQGLLFLNNLLGLFAE